MDGSLDGEMLGDEVGMLLGVGVGLSDGEDDGATLGPEVGTKVGEIEGLLEILGLAEGSSKTTPIGTVGRDDSAVPIEADGLDDARRLVGRDDGTMEGESEGTSEGESDVCMLMEPSRRPRNASTSWSKTAFSSSISVLVTSRALLSMSVWNTFSYPGMTELL